MANRDEKLKESKTESDSHQKPNPEGNVNSKSDVTHVSETALPQTNLKDEDIQKVASEVRKSPGDKSTNTEEEEISSSGRKVKIKEASKGSDKAKGRTTPPARESEVIWKHTAAAENKVRVLEKAAELERKLKVKTASAAQQTKGEQTKKIGSATKEIPTILVAAASSQFFDAQSELPKPLNESRLSPKRAEKRSNTKLKKQVDSDKKAEEQSIPSHEETPKKVVVDSSRTLTPPADTLKKPKSTVEPQPRPSKSKREKFKGDLRVGQGHGQTARGPTTRKMSSEVAETSIEEEILNRTDPDLEEAIMDSIFFSYKITEPSVRPDDLAAYIQKIREEEAEELAAEEAAEAAAEERDKEAWGGLLGLIRKETDVSIALSSDSAEERERIRRKQLSWTERLLEMVDDAFSEL